MARLIVFTHAHVYIDVNIYTLDVIQENLKVRRQNCSSLKKRRRSNHIGVNAPAYWCWGQATLSPCCGKDKGLDEVLDTVLDDTSEMIPEEDGKQQERRVQKNTPLSVGHSPGSNVGNEVTDTTVHVHVQCCVCGKGVSNSDVKVVCNSPQCSMVVHATCAGYSLRCASWAK